MKKTLAILMAAGLLLCACQPDEPVLPSPTPQPAPSLAGTAWEAAVHDTYLGYPAVLLWSLDFLTDSTGELFLDLTVAGQQQAPLTLPFSYTFDGTSGILTGSETDFTIGFDYDADAQTVTIDLYITTDEGTIGGTTVFRPRGSDDPQPPDEPAFPAGTAWQAVEQGTFNHDSVPDGLPVTVRWTLDLWADHTGTLTIRIEFDGTDQSMQQSSLIGWTYNPQNQTGDISVGNHSFVFTYLPDEDAIAMEIHISIRSGNSSSIFGGNLHFGRLDGGEKTHLPHNIINELRIFGTHNPL